MDGRGRRFVEGESKRRKRCVSMDVDNNDEEGRPSQSSLRYL